MIQRPENITRVIDGVERYNPENLDVLENYLNQQCDEAKYDVETNLVILKLYQFNPQLAKESVISKILVKALTAIPAADFTLCLYLLSEHADLDSIKKLSELQQLLEQSRYEKFWKSDLTACHIVPNFEKEIRQMIARVVTMSYQTVNASILAGYLGLNGAQFDQFCKDQEWQKNGDIITIPGNKDNEAKTVVIRENIKFEQLTKVIGYSNEM